MHVAIQPLHRLRQHGDLRDIGLLSIPVSKGVDRHKVGRLRDATALSRFEREIDLVDAGEVLIREVRVLAERHGLIEVVDELIVQLVPRNEEAQPQNQRRGRPEQRRPLRDHEIGDAVYKRGFACPAELDPHRQHRYEGRQG